MQAARVEAAAFAAARATPPLRLNLRVPHSKQTLFIDSTAKRKVIRAGRRGGKTVGVATLAVRAFQAGRRILYATPTGDQIARFWFEVKRALQADIDAKVLKVNETEHYVERARRRHGMRTRYAATLLICSSSMSIS